MAIVRRRTPLHSGLLDVHSVVVVHRRLVTEAVVVRTRICVPKEVLTNRLPEHHC